MFYNKNVFGANGWTNFMCGVWCVDILYAIDIL